MPSIAHPDWPPELDHGPPDGLVGSVDLEHKNVLFVQSVRFSEFRQLFCSYVPFLVYWA